MESAKLEFNEETFAQMFEEFLSAGRGVVLYGYGIDLVHGKDSIPKFSKWFASQVWACLDFHNKSKDLEEPTLPAWMSDPRKVQAAKDMGFLK